MEAIALIADIHANLLAAEAVLSDIHKKHRPDRIISLGDQVNLGPAPRDTLRLLRSENVTCLHGNHEGYILSAMNNDSNMPAQTSLRCVSMRRSSNPTKSPFKNRYPIQASPFAMLCRKMTAFPCLTQRWRFPACKKKRCAQHAHHLRPRTQPSALQSAKFNARRDRQYGLHG